MISAITISNIFYIVRKASDLQRARESVELCLEAYEIAEVTALTLEVAIDMKGPDFEDDIQIACALAGGAESIITRDPAGFAGAPIPVITPAQAGERLGIA